MDGPHRAHHVYRRASGEVTLYRCLERISDGDYAVFCAHRVRQPVQASYLRNDDWRFSSLMRRAPGGWSLMWSASLAEAIDRFDIGFDPSSESGVLQARLLRLHKIAWHRRQEWTADVHQRVLTFCSLAIPFCESGSLNPSRPYITNTVLAQLTDNDRARVDKLTRDVVDMCSRRNSAPSSATHHLFSLVIATGILVDAGELLLEADPGEVMLELLEGGFEFAQDHGRLEVFHAKGIASFKMPSREDFVAGRRPL